MRGLQKIQKKIWKENSKTGIVITINITFSRAAIFGCEARIVAIGGGGRGVRGGGGGSGYVKSKVIDVTSTAQHQLLQFLLHSQRLRHMKM